MKKIIFLLALLIQPNLGMAVYNSNLQGVIKEIYVYSDGDYIYFRLINQPSSHPGCNPTYFVIDERVPLHRQQTLLSRLLTAYASKENINIGYDGNGDCAHNYIRVHRIG